MGTLTETLLDYLLAMPESPPETYATPWGPTRRLPWSEMIWRQRSGHGFTNAELWMLLRDRLEDEGRSPQQAAIGATSMVRRLRRMRKRAY